MSAPPRARSGFKTLSMVPVTRMAQAARKMPAQRWPLESSTAAIGSMTRLVPTDGMKAARKVRSPKKTGCGTRAMR